MTNETTFKEFINSSAWAYKKANTFFLHKNLNGLYFPSGDNEEFILNNLLGTREEYIKLVKKYMPNIKIINFGFNNNEVL